MQRLKSVFKDSVGLKLFLLSVLITGLSYGLYKGMLDNFLAEVVGMTQMDRGITEFFRELPGIALVFILAVFDDFVGGIRDREEEKAGGSEDLVKIVE